MRLVTPACTWGNPSPSGQSHKNSVPTRRSHRPCAGTSSTQQFCCAPAAGCPQPACDHRLSRASDREELGDRSPAGAASPSLWGPPQSPWNVRSPGLCTAWSLHTFGQEGGTSTATPTSSTFPRPAETPKGTHTFVGGRLLCIWAESREPCPPGEAWGLLWRVQWGFDSLKEAGREPWPDSTTYPSVYPVRRCLWAPSMRGALPGRGEDLQGCSVRDA